jgi:hypothetical protein
LGITFGKSGPARPEILDAVPKDELSKLAPDCAGALSSRPQQSKCVLASENAIEFMPRGASRPKNGRYQ